MRKVSWVRGTWTFANVVTLALLVAWGPGVATPRSVGTVVQEGEQGSAVRTVDALPQPDAATQLRVAAAYGTLPLHFEANQGQTDGQVQFVGRGPGLSLFLTPTEAVLVLRPSQQPGRAPGAEAGVRRLGRAPDPSEPPQPAQAPEPTVLRLHFVGGNAAPQVVGLEELPGGAHASLHGKAGRDGHHGGALRTNADGHGPPEPRHPQQRPRRSRG